MALLLVFAFSLSWDVDRDGMKMRTPETVMQMTMTILFPPDLRQQRFVDP